MKKSIRFGLKCSALILGIILGIQMGPSPLVQALTFTSPSWGGGIATPTMKSVTEMGSISGYVPTHSGATTDYSDASCGPAYHYFKFYLYDGNPEDETYDGYYAEIEKYRINLHTDFVENVDLDSLTCSTPFSDDSGDIIYIDCDDDSYTKTTGGYHLTVTTNLTMSRDGTASILWTYSSPDGAEPTLPYVATIDGYLNYYYEIVGFEPNDDVRNGDTATTDAEIFWTTYGINIERDGSWTPSELADDADIGYDNHAWYTDGDTAVTNYEDCDECNDLTITSPTEITAENADNVTAITIAPEDQDGDTWDGSYEYAGYESDGTTVSSCTFTTSTYYASQGWGSNPLNTDYETVYVYNCGVGDIITVKEVDYEDACSAELFIEDACASLKITSPTTLTYEDMEGGDIQITIQSTDESGATWSGEYTYTATKADGTPADGTFSWSSILAGLSGENPYTTTRTTVYYGGGDAGDIITVTDTAYPDVCYDSIASTVPYCGDGLLDSNGLDNRTGTEDDEACDDGNTADGDGCSSTCQLEAVEACATLEITDPTVITYEDMISGEDIPVTIQSTSTDGGTWTGEYTYTATQVDGITEANGTFSTSSWFAGTWLGSNPYTTTAISVYYGGGDPGDMIFVQETSSPTGVCYDSLSSMLTEEPYCASLTTSPTSITVDQLTGITPITLTDVDQDGAPWTGTYTVSSTNADATATGSCKFTETIDGTGIDTLTTSASIVYVYGCTSGDTITIVETTYPATCNATLATGTIPAPYCGDGVLDLDGADNTVGTADDEVCDDGNNVDGDTCSANCQLETITSVCTDLSIIPGSTSATQVVFTITPTPSTYVSTWIWTTTNASGQFTADEGLTIGNTITSGDLSVEYHGAVDDVITVKDTNAAYSSVCSATANITGGGSGDGDDGGGSSDGGGGGTTYCGDGIINNPPYYDYNSYGTWEECDDGNSINDDGCSNVCQVEDVCADMDVTEPTTDTLEKKEGDIVTFKVQAYYYNNEEDDEKTPWTDDPYTWTSNDPTGTFTTTTNTSTDDGTTETLDTYETEITYKVGTNPDADIAVNVDSYSACSADFSIQHPSLTLSDTLEKFVYTYNFGFFAVDNTSINGNSFKSDTTEGVEGDAPVYAHDFDYTFYTIAYTPDPTHRSEIKITDTIADGIKGLYNDGITAPSPNSSIDYYTAIGDDPMPVRCWVDGNTTTGEDCGLPVGTYRPFSVQYDDELKTKIENCDTPASDGSLKDDGTSRTIKDEGTTCFSGDIGTSDGVTLKNLNNTLKTTDAITGETKYYRVAIRYLGRVDNGGFECASEAMKTVACPVVGLTNTAKADGRLEASTTITIICPYFLTRNAGDVYLEEELSQSYDISCYYPQDRNSDGLVFLSKIFEGITSSCDTPDNNSTVGRFSSYICEMLSDVETVTTWSKATIQEIQNANIAAITPYEDNLNTDDADSYTVKNFEDLSAIHGVVQSNEKQNVYKVTGKDLIFDLGINRIPSGAYTFIVEDGDLIINSNIEYLGGDSFNMDTVTDLSSIPSIAFIVLGGDVYVENNVTEMVGVYYIEARDGKGGNLTGRWTDPFTKLVIRGSVYGNIESLLQNRTYAGPANYDQGNVVLRYDERVLLNTPPGLEEFVDVQSEEVAR